MAGGPRYLQEAPESPAKAPYEEIREVLWPLATGYPAEGAWHFHALLFVPPSFGPVKKLRCFVASSWYEVCGKVSEGHLLAGTHVEEVRSWRKATSYAERYMAKQEQFPEGLRTGRIWGKWNEELLPVQWETVKVTLKDAYRIRRVYRRLAKMREGGIYTGSRCS